MQLFNEKKIMNKSNRVTLYCHVFGIYSLLKPYLYTIVCLFEQFVDFKT